MGITIHYRGKLDRIEDFDLMTKELTSIADERKWKIHKVNDDWSLPVDARLEHGDRGASIVGNLGLRGVSLNAGKGAEPLSFYVDKHGNLNSIFGPVFRDDPDFPPGTTSWISCKTQYVGPETHAWMVGLLKYVKRKYASDLEVNDESKYWDTGDMAALREYFAMMDRVLDQFGKVLESADWGDMKDASAEQVADRIEKIVRDRGDEMLKKE